MQLRRKKKTSAVVGLDIEAGSIAATEVELNGVARVTATAVGPLAPGSFHEGEVTDPDALVSSLKAFFDEHKLTKHVRLGIGNQRVVVRTMRLPAIEDPKEMEAAVRFQAQEQIPMPLDQAVLEHQVVGGVAAEEGAAPQVDVVIAAARRDMIASFLEPLNRAGLQPVGIDLSAFAMIRALADVDGVSVVTEPGQRPEATVLYCSVGDVTNLAVARGRACAFTRVSHVGLEGIVGRLTAGGRIAPEHASQWLSYVGLDRPLEQLEGDPEILAEVRAVAEEGLTGLTDELRLSLDYYGAQEGALPVERIVLCGQGSAIAGLSARMEERLGLPIVTARPPALAAIDDDVAARLTLAYGLALES